MTPKEKAKEIYDGMKGFRVKNSHRKKCALICVDEILGVLEFTMHFSGKIATYEYWQEVKKEIENL